MREISANELNTISMGIIGGGNNVHDLGVLEWAVAIGQNLVASALWAGMVAAVNHAMNAPSPTSGPGFPANTDASSANAVNGHDSQSDGYKG